MIQWAKSYLCLGCALKDLFTEHELNYLLLRVEMQKVLYCFRIKLSAQHITKLSSADSNTHTVVCQIVGFDPLCYLLVCNHGYLHGHTMWKPRIW